MLELRNITKTYDGAGEPVEALRGISLTFGESEFVSVLGPSGCGKTTLLNIIGGLDRYTGGELLINGRSTAEYKDRDWDGYRNHSIGFVFQSYNLIPHQTVLQNVELALSLSGVGKIERRKRATEALKRVGLENQLRKRPAEMSGGQMQRVAIARAIVNDPDIILADEPTGALDTETSVQVMDILKDISKDRLVIMVTHNPELAEKYSTRIVRMLDGKITSDSGRAETAPVAAEVKTKSGKRASMSLRTGFGLSLKNLFTKKGRTILTSFAGSIGIIGIALIYAVSNGMTGYIDRVQEETLSSYPLTLEGRSLDTSSFISTFMGKAKSLSDHDDDGIYQKGVIFELTNAMNSMEEKKNDLKSFKAFLEKERADENSELHSTVSAVQYTYSRGLSVYTKTVDDEIIRSDLNELMTELIANFWHMDTSMLTSMATGSVMSSSYGMMESYSRLWQEMLPGDDGQIISPLFRQEYELAYGHWPEKFDEVMLIVDEKGEIGDLSLYALGLMSKEDMVDLMNAAASKQQVDFTPHHWTYEEICGLDFRVILEADCFEADPATGTYRDLRGSATGMRYLYDNGLQLHIAGILKPNGDSASTMLKDGVAYTSLLTEYVMDKNNNSPAVKAQMEQPAFDVIEGLPFRNSSALTDADKAETFRRYAGAMDDAAKAEAYRKLKSVPDEAAVAEKTDAALAAMDRAQMESIMLPAAVEQMGMSEAIVSAYLKNMDDATVAGLLRDAMLEQFRAEAAAEAARMLEGSTDEELAAAFDKELPDFTEAYCAECYATVLQFSDADYESNLNKLGYLDPDAPSSINLYASSFEDKDRISEQIALYNRTVDPMSEITYVDYISLLLSSVTTIINAISYVLIAFVAISLIVSSIMIGVITLISVQERTKEIGILRSLGASKKNVSAMFNAETVLIGFASGLLGVCITWLLCIPINAILHNLTGISNLSAYLDPLTAAILVVISMLLTLIAGIIPSRSAAKKDPVVALRTE